ncbi:MAG: hypothetical protein AAF490_21625 [Chloroflexota bacterium]
MTALPTKTSEGTIYEVFARFREPEMRHIGTVIAVNDDLAKIYADKLYDESGWREMTIVPRSEILTVVAVQ